MVLASLSAGLPPSMRGRLTGHVINFKMDNQNDIIAFLKQNVERQLILEAGIKAEVDHFNLGLQPHRNFQKLVEKLAKMCWASVHGFPVWPLVTPHKQ